MTRKNPQKDRFLNINLVMLESWASAGSEAYLMKRQNSRTFVFSRNSLVYSCVKFAWE